MNASQFKKLIALLLIVGSIGFLFLAQDQKSWNKSEAQIGGKVFPDFPLNDVTAVSIKDADGEIALSKSSDIWTVSDRWDYAADFSKISNLIRDIWDLKVTRNVPAGPSQYGRLELVTPGEGANSGTLLTFKGKDGNEIASLLLGKEHMRKSEAPSQFGGGGEFPDGRYVLPNGNGEGIALVSETFSGIDVDANYWLNKDFLKVEKLQAAEVTHPEDTESWSVSRDSDSADMVLAGLAENEELDSTKSYSLKNILSSPSFNDVVDPSSSDEDNGFDSPVLAKLTTFDGFTYDVKIGKPDSEDNYPVHLSVSADIQQEREKPEDEKEEDTERLDTEFAAAKKTLEEKLEKEKAFEKWTYKVSKWTVDALLNKRSDLVKEKEEEEASDTTAEAGPPAPVIPAPIEIPPVNIDEPESGEEDESAEETETSDAGPDTEDNAVNVEEAIEAVTNPLPAPKE